MSGTQKRHYFFCMFCLIFKPYVNAIKPYVNALRFSVICAVFLLFV